MDPKPSTIVSFFLFSGLLLVSLPAASGEELSFDLKGKTREKDGVHQFFIPHPENGFSLLILPGDPKELCSKTSAEGAAMMKEREGLEVGRYHIVGKCVLHESGKYHTITSIEKMLPLGPGVVRDEEMEIVGTLEVRGEPTSEDWLKDSDMIVHGNDGLSFRIPSKKFKPKPSGLDYQQAALLNGKTIKMRAKVQIHPELPHRVATVHEFGLAGE